MQGSHFYQQCDHVKLVALLIENGADMTIWNVVSVLHSALAYSLNCAACLCIVCNGFYERMHVTPGQEGNPPLHHAVYNCNVALLSHLSSEETVNRLNIDGHMKNKVRSITDER